jgi:hypothetical protein
MENFGFILIQMVGLFFDQVSTFLSSLSDMGIFMFVGCGGAIIAFAVALSHGDIQEGVLADVKKWHGKIAEQFENINNAYEVLSTHAKTAWAVPPDMISALSDYVSQLQRLIKKCSDDYGSKSDRLQRDALLKEAVSYCLVQVRLWVYGVYGQGHMAVEDVHTLRFLLPGEMSGTPSPRSGTARSRNPTAERIRLSSEL